MAFNKTTFRANKAAGKAITFLQFRPQRVMQLMQTHKLKRTGAVEKAERLFRKYITPENYLAFIHGYYPAHQKEYFGLAGALVDTLRGHGASTHFDDYFEAIELDPKAILANRLKFDRVVFAVAAGFILRKPQLDPIEAIRQAKRHIELVNMSCDFHPNHTRDIFSGVICATHTGLKFLQALVSSGVVSGSAVREVYGESASEIKDCVSTMQLFTNVLDGEDFNKALNKVYAHAVWVLRDFTAKSPNAIHSGLVAAGHQISMVATVSDYLNGKGRLDMVVMLYEWFVLTTQLDLTKLPVNHRRMQVSKKLYEGSMKKDALYAKLVEISLEKTGKHNLKTMSGLEIEPRRSSKQRFLQLCKTLGVDMADVCLDLGFTVDDCFEVIPENTRKIKGEFVVEIASKFQTLRKSKKLSTMEVASRCNFRQDFISAFELGKAGQNFPIYDKILKALGCTWVDLQNAAADERVIENSARNAEIRAQLSARLKYVAEIKPSDPDSLTFAKLGFGPSPRNKGIVEGWWLPAPPTLERIARRIKGVDLPTFLGLELHQRYMEAING